MKNHNLIKIIKNNINSLNSPTLKVINELIPSENLDFSLNFQSLYEEMAITTDVIFNANFKYLMTESENFKLKFLSYNNKFDFNFQNTSSLFIRSISGEAVIYKFQIEDAHLISTFDIAYGKTLMLEKIDIPNNMFIELFYEQNVFYRIASESSHYSFLTIQDSLNKINPYKYFNGHNNYLKFPAYEADMYFKKKILVLNNLFKNHYEKNKDYTLKVFQDHFPSLDINLVLSLLLDIENNKNYKYFNQELLKSISKKIPLIDKIAPKLRDQYV